MIAEAVSSHTSCDNEIVNVPERGRIDVVTRSIIVKVVKWLFLKWWIWKTLEDCECIHVILSVSNPLLFRQRE